MGRGSKHQSMLPERTYTILSGGHKLIQFELFELMWWLRWLWILLSNILWERLEWNNIHYSDKMDIEKYNIAERTNNQCKINKNSTKFMLSKV